MELTDYLKTTMIPWSDENWLPWKKKEWPKFLNLSNEMVAKFKELYATGDNQKVEMGYTLKFFPKTQTYKYGKLIKGTRHRCPLPTEVGDEAFGNVHSHPSGAAHSPADIAAHEPNLKKAVFVAFVVAAPNRIYAVISRFNKSKLDKVNISEMQSSTESKMTEYFEKFCPVPKKQRHDVMYGEMGVLKLNPHLKTTLQEEYKDIKLQKGETFESFLITHYQELCQKHTPGFANRDRALSEMNILSLKNHGFGVYMSDQSAVGKLVCL